jgi:hypothetical protein
MEISVPTVTKNYFPFCNIIFKISYFLAQSNQCISTLILNTHLISVSLYNFYEHGL